MPHFNLQFALLFVFSCLIASLAFINNIKGDTFELELPNGAIIEVDLPEGVDPDPDFFKRIEPDPEVLVTGEGEIQNIESSFDSIEAKKSVLEDLKEPLGSFDSAIEDGLIDFKSLLNFDNCVVTVNGQSVNINSDGSFSISNIAAPDQFGLGGPGSSPDFLSDDFVRVVAICTRKNETVIYAFSEPFQIKQGETYVVGQLTVTQTPPPFPDTLRMSVDDPTLTAIGQTTQLHVTGVLVDGSEIDVTPRTAWTIYRTSNPDVATVGRDGLVTATGAGTVFTTAVNEGATAVKQILVVPGDPLTTVEGFVQLEDGTPVMGADVTLLALSEITGFDGFFQITGVPTELGALSVRATISISGERFVGAKEITTFVKGGVTDAGIITVKKSERVALIHGDIFRVQTLKSALVATGFFRDEDITILAIGQSSTPNLSTILEFGAVLVFSNSSFRNPDLLGDTLADYVDQGGKVVLSTYVFSQPWRIGGRIMQPGMSPFEVSNARFRTTGVLDLANSDTTHPILAGVNSSSYFVNSNYTNPVLTDGSTLVASDTGGNNLIAVNSSNNIVGISIFGGFAGICCSSGEVNLIFANALNFLLSR